ncbi:MAG: FAD-binding protein, partial [Candidatus Omnitrophica bacterium]|nr:FAD-binding protein [Candidatus Omnitrophota bacterium]
YKKDHLMVRRIIEGGHQVLKVPIPCLISVTPTATAARRPSLVGAIKAKSMKIETWNLDQIGLKAEEVGLIGSPTMVAKVVDIVRTRPPLVMMSGRTPADLVEDLIRQFKKLSPPTETSVTNEAQKGSQASPDSGAAKPQPAKKFEYPRVDFRRDARGILTWVEVYGKTPARSSLEILNPARRLADELQTKVTSVVIGDGIQSLAREIIAYGADEVILVNDPRLKDYSTLPVTAVMTQVIRKVRPEIALFGATTSGRELAPRIASRVRAGVTADCTNLRIGEFVYAQRKSIMYPCLESIRPTYGESKLATIVGFWCPQMATARPGTFKMLTPDPNRKGNVTEFVPEFTDGDFAVEIVRTVREEGGAQNLFVADVIVSGGRSCGELDNFQLVKDLAKALQDQGVNADWGASRQAVDNGYAPYARQIGQTGKTVRPKVYIAVAISGAIQHLAGIKESEKIIAVNLDPNASIFRHGDYGIARDYLEVLPELIRAVKNGFTFGIKPH